VKTYTLIGADGRPYQSETPGSLGGHRRQKGYGRLDCPSALRWIAKGHYVKAAERVTTHENGFVDDESRQINTRTRSTVRAQATHDSWGIIERMLARTSC
jgi:hypothetical protein